MAASMRLQRYLASAGVAARRKAESLITAGRVKVNGEVVRVLGSKVDPDEDQIEVDGQAVVALDNFYVLLNKPKACITAVTDDRGRPTVMNYLPNVPIPVKPVGRLDFYTEGVLLLTNDGELASRLLAPGNHVPKTYHVKVHGELALEDIKHLRKGVQLEDGSVTMPADVAVLPGESKHTWLAITIHEGKHRQIHRMIEALGFRVDKLQRVAFASLTFHELRVGDARELTQAEVNELRDLVGLDRSPVARGTWRSSREETDIPRRARAKARAEAEAELDERNGPDDLDDWAAPDATGHHRRLPSPASAMRGSARATPSSSDGSRTARGATRGGYGVRDDARREGSVTRRDSRDDTRRGRGSATRRGPGNATQRGPRGDVRRGPRDDRRAPRDARSDPRDELRRGARGGATRTQGGGTRNSDGEPRGGGSEVRRGGGGARGFGHKNASKVRGWRGRPPR